uniref:ETS variant transcription factor 1 n=1 Tax=Cyprinus carpio TaxID=7962 RepID=A0A8C2HQA2_CYPCA
ITLLLQSQIPAKDRKRKFINSDLALDTEELFQDLSQLQETWLAEVRILVFCLNICTFVSFSVAFHGLQLRIKREPHSPCTDLGSACSQERPFRIHYGEKCLYNIRCFISLEEPTCPRIADGTQAEPTTSISCVILILFSVLFRFRRQLSEPCHSFPSPSMSRDGRPMYHRQMSEPSIPFPPQGFKQEYGDPLFEHPAMVGAPLPQTYPHSMMIKQEPRDFTYDSEVPSCHSVYLRQEGYLAHNNRTEGCMFDKVARHFYDDTCVVPEKVEMGVRSNFFLLCLRETSVFLQYLHFRSLRYYYEKGIMQKVAGERYVYKFVCDPEALFSMAFPDNQRPVLKTDLERQINEEDTVPLSHFDENMAYIQEGGYCNPHPYNEGYVY